MDFRSPNGNPVLYVTQGSGNSFKPALALHQLQLACDVRFVDVLGGQTRQPAFLGVNKAGQVPYYLDGQGNGFAQSNAILWRIADDTPLMPASAADRATALQWMFFEQTRLEPNISPARFFTAIVPERAAPHLADIPRWRAKALDGLTLLDDHLASSRFVVKRHGYSVGDIGVFGYVHMADEAGIDLGPFRAVRRWIERVQATPRFQPVSALLAPPQVRLVG